MPIRSALIGVAGGAVLVAAAWTAWNWHGDTRYDDGYQQAITDTKAQADAQALASASRLAALEHAHSEIARLEHEKESALAAAVDAGRVRLHVNATCPRVPEAADAGVGLRTHPELKPDARQDYFALRAANNQVTTALAKCQAAVRELTANPPPAR